MTPLSDALTAAQRSALAALEKAYVAEAVDAEQLRAGLHSCGISDDIDISFLTHALDVLREWGVTAPTMSERVAGESQQPPKASESQVSYIMELLKKGNHEPLAEADIRALTVASASALITDLKEGNYYSSGWDVPF